MPINYQPLVDFNYYKDVYNGSLIETETAFNSVCTKACAVLANYTMDRVFMDEYRNNELVKNCVCELCELEQISKNQLNSMNNQEGKSIASEKVGDYSVSYDSSNSLTNAKVMARKQKDIIDTYLGRLGLLYKGAYVY